MANSTQLWKCNQYLKIGETEGMVGHFVQPGGEMTELEWQTLTQQFGASLGVTLSAVLPNTYSTLGLIVQCMNDFTEYGFTHALSVAGQLSVPAVPDSLYYMLRKRGLHVSEGPMLNYIRVPGCPKGSTQVGNITIEIQQALEDYIDLLTTPFDGAGAVLGKNLRVQVARKKEDKTWRWCPSEQCQVDPQLRGLKSRRTS